MLNVLKSEKKTVIKSDKTFKKLSGKEILAFMEKRNLNNNLEFDVYN